jgi:hypothetical protein
MKILITSLVLITASLSAGGCADDAELTTTVAELTETERAAMASCLAEITECRATSTDAEDFAEQCSELMACLPDRDIEQSTADDWRAYCAGVKARCSEGDIDEATCAELRTRCDRARRGDRGEGGGDSGASAAMKACYEACTGNGGTPESCRAECAGAL